MVSSQPHSHLVDVGEVKVEIGFDERSVDLVARGDDPPVLYRLQFDRCQSIAIRYTDDEDDLSPYDLTDGIHEHETVDPDVRLFTIHFMDESTIEISCRKFEMSVIDE